MTGYVPLYVAALVCVTCELTYSVLVPYTNYCNSWPKILVQTSTQCNLIVGVCQAILLHQMTDQLEYFYLFQEGTIERNNSYILEADDDNGSIRASMIDQNLQQTALDSSVALTQVQRRTTLVVIKQQLRSKYKKRFKVIRAIYLTLIFLILSLLVSTIGVVVHRDKSIDPQSCNVSVFFKQY